MLEQTIRLVNFENTNAGIVLRFGQLGNTSHQKELLKDVNEVINNAWKEVITAGNPYNKDEEEFKKELYSIHFPTLNHMNEKGWKLESFATIYDDSMLKMQVAIFSREVPAK